jgi:Holliday junction resolvase RusA-like endonuclease
MGLTKITATRKIRLLITPQTYERSTQREKWFFRVTDEYLIENYPPRYIQKKRRLIKYKAYKQALREEAARVGFELPDCHAWIKFYIPMPPSWKPSKRAKMQLEPHRSRPDASNLYKAFEDSLKQQDMGIWDYRVSKFWFDSLKGFIEIEVPSTYLLKHEIHGLLMPIAQDAVIK